MESMYHTRSEWVPTLRAFQRLLLASLCSELCSIGTGEHGGTIVSFDLVELMGACGVDGVPLPCSPDVLSPHTWGKLLWFCETEPPRARAIDISQGRAHLRTRSSVQKHFDLPEVEFAWHCGRYQDYRWSIEPEPEPDGEPESAGAS